MALEPNEVSDQSAPPWLADLGFLGSLFVMHGNQMVPEADSERYDQLDAQADRNIRCSLTQFVEIFKAWRILSLQT